jgi:hypothetical protein
MTNVLNLAQAPITSSPLYGLLKPMECYFHLRRYGNENDGINRGLRKVLQ